MRIPQTSQQRTKALVHGVQALVIFLTGCLALAVLTKSGGTGAETGFMLGLCFLSVPALIYQVMVPMWSRAWRFANVYAYATFDLVFALLWFASFVSVAVWTDHGISKGEKAETSSDSASGCSAFAYGSASKCKTSQASAGLGALVWLLFIGSSYLSIKAIIAHRRAGLPLNGSQKQSGAVEQLGGDQEASKDAWSTDTMDLDARPDSSSALHPGADPFTDRFATEGQEMGGYDHGSQNGMGGYDHGSLNGRYQPSVMGSIHSSVSPANPRYAGYDSSSRPSTRHSIRQTPHPGRMASFTSGPHAETLSIRTPAYDDGRATSAMSPEAVTFSPGGHMNFPQGNYGEAFR